MRRPELTIGQGRFSPSRSPPGSPDSLNARAWRHTKRTMRLWGSLTSPYVRRVRVVALELGISVELKDAFTEEGQRQLRSLTPVWKVPTVELLGRVLWDSAVIIDALVSENGFGPLRAPSAAARHDEACLRATIDAGLDTLIKLFYLGKDGVDVANTPYLIKDSERARAILAWLDARLHGTFCTTEEGFGLTELALYTALDWMSLRAMASFEELPNLRAFVEAHAARPSLVATAPPR